MNDASVRQLWGKSGGIKCTMFQAFDVASIPELYGNDMLIKPTTNNLIHVAKSENNDWNVYGDDSFADGLCNLK